MILKKKTLQTFKRSMSTTSKLRDRFDDTTFYKLAI